jgi:hypothetical protein
MPTGLKASSSTVAIGFVATELAANTFIQASVDLNMSPLDREVFVVTSINLDPLEPDCIAGTNTATSASVTTTSQTSVQNLSNANCLATAKLAIRSDPTNSVSFSRMPETPAATLDYLGIIATNDFFIQCIGNGNAGAKAVAGKLYGYRAKATADIYSALVQSEVLSA